ncbi:hypothetical protein AJ79_05406 [Helicocarpus griseus UAMH5409]|uniref:Vacuolar ATPase assembly protein VMA22 n=1 Tax=Helicocarpus griseus UAMH5409 TaxID=1447875 RepID=A0A2B7XP53_9EURO|nr:hypothetical protein AJ79_05406 [Helicocarpus griseus UAMH5409]
MAHLPTPPATPAPEASKEQSSPVKSYAELSQELDSVLERYLSLLDRQQLLQEEIGRQVSSVRAPLEAIWPLHRLILMKRKQGNNTDNWTISKGFLSLARANNSCPPGRRYGEDYYDERMKATKKLFIAVPSSKTNASLDKPTNSNTDQTSSDISFVVTSILASNGTEKETKADTKGKKDNEETGAASRCGSSTSGDLEPSKDSEKPDGNIPTTKISNPINWFGILVPTTLRSAQQSFCSAVEGPVPALAGVVTEMRETEREVEELRSQLASAIVNEDKGEGVNT